MLDSESIDKMLIRFNKISNGLASLDEKLLNGQNVRKIIQSLPKAWEVNAITLKELNDSKEIDINIFMDNFKTHEMEMKVRKDKDHQAKASQRMSVTLKFSFKKVMVDYLGCNLNMRLLF